MDKKSPKEYVDELIARYNAIPKSPAGYPVIVNNPGFVMDDHNNWWAEGKLSAITFDDKPTHDR